MPWNVTSDPHRAEEAIAWFRKRVPVLKVVWDALEEKAREQAFTVAGASQMDLVHDVWEAIDEAIANGTTFETFKATIGDRLTRDWGEQRPRRLQTIFRTNVQLAYSAGRHWQMTEPAVKSARPFWLFDAVIDNATSTICRERNGVLLPADHPWWRFNYPPLHFECRSGARTLTRAQAEARGITEAPTPEPPQEGFGHEPGTGAWHPDPSKYPVELWLVFEEKRR